MTDERREKIYQWVMASGLQDVLFYKVKDAKGNEIVMDRFENFEAFAWNAEQAEREECASIAEEESMRGLPDEKPKGTHLKMAVAQIVCGTVIADVIRRRGEA